MKKAKVEALHARLLKRWVTMLESEMDSDGFWEDVAEALELEDVGDLTESHIRDAHEFIRAARQWMSRYPVPRLPS